MDKRRKLTEDRNDAQQDLGIRPLARRELKVIKAGDPAPGTTSNASPEGSDACFCICASPVGEMC